MTATAKTLLMILALAALSSSAFAKTKKAVGAQVRWKEVPAAAQTAIQSNAAGGKVVQVDKETANNILFYLAEVKGTDGKWSKVYVTDTGSLMKVEPDKARNNRKHKPLFGG
jgi:hypothetical protein